MAYINTPKSKQVQRLPLGHSVVTQRLFTLILLSDVLGRVRMKFCLANQKTKLKDQ